MVTNTASEDHVFRALADDTRRQIVRRLAVEPLPVHRLASAFDVTRPAVSRHLRILREAGLVDVAESGRENVYRLCPAPLRDIEGWLHDIWSSRLAMVKSLVEELPNDDR